MYVCKWGDMSSRIAEVLAVLDRVRARAGDKVSRSDIRNSRLKATKEVAAVLGITHETVRDACTRQLQPYVHGVAHFDELLYHWLAAGSPELRTIVLSRTVDSTDAAAVERFFASVSSSSIAPAI